EADRDAPERRVFDRVPPRLVEEAEVRPDVPVVLGDDGPARILGDHGAEADVQAALARRGGPDDRAAARDGARLSGPGLLLHEDRAAALRRLAVARAAEVEARRVVLR